MKQANRITLEEVIKLVDVPTNEDVTYESMGVGRPRGLDPETAFYLAQEIKRGDYGALRAFLEVMRYFTEKRIFDLGAKGYPGGPIIIDAFQAFESTLLEMFRPRETENGTIRP